MGGIIMEMKYNALYPDGDRPSLFEEALEFQDFVVNIFLKELGIAISNYSSKYYQHNYGENRQGIEIKYDKRILETGNVSIEVAEKSNASIENWTNSGIMREDNTWLYVQGNYNIIFIFSKSFLQKLYKVKYKNKVWQPKKTIKTFLMPLEEAYKYSIKFFKKELEK